MDLDHHVGPKSAIRGEVPSGSQAQFGQSPFHRSNRRSGPEPLGSKMGPEKNTQRVTREQAGRLLQAPVHDQGLRGGPAQELQQEAGLAPLLRAHVRRAAEGGQVGAPEAHAPRAPARGCCGSLGVFFGSILPEIWICFSAIFRDETNRSRAWLRKDANSKQGGTGCWLVPNNVGTFLPESSGYSRVIVISTIPRKQENYGMSIA